MSDKSNSEPKFSLGGIVATPGALNALAESSQSPEPFLNRHVSGDWGDELCDEDKELNDVAVKEGDRILSAYRTSKGVKFWIITEADRSVTTFLLPEDY